MATNHKSEPNRFVKTQMFKTKTAKTKMAKTKGPKPNGKNHKRNIIVQDKSLDREPEEAKSEIKIKMV